MPHIVRMEPPLTVLEGEVIRMIAHLEKAEYARVRKLVFKALLNTNSGDVGATTERHDHRR